MHILILLEEYMHGKDRTFFNGTIKGIIFRSYLRIELNPYPQVYL